MAKSKRITSIGGQALIEGIMMRGPHTTAAAFVSHDGTVTAETFEVKTLREKYPFLNLPLLRGTVMLIDSLRIGMKMLNTAADRYMEDVGEEEEPGRFEAWLNRVFGEKVMDVMMSVATVLALILAVVLFVFLPSLAGQGLDLLAGGRLGIWRSVFEGLLRMAIFVGYVGLCSLIPDVRRTFEFHGAEHKTIFCYENELPLTVENVRVQSRFHPRCGTSFLMLTLIVGIVIGFFIPFENPFLRTGVKLLLIPLTMGVGYELIRLCGKHDNRLTRIIAAPGLWVQRLTVKEPDDTMIRAAIAAMELVIPENGEDLVG